MAAIECKNIKATRNGADDYAVPYWDVDSGVPGPRVLVFATQHGQEPNGAEVCRLFGDVAEARLSRGSCMLFPFANPLALRARQPHIDFELGRYYGRDHENSLNSVWPGKPDGNDTQRLGHALFNSVIKEATHCLDLHSWQGKKAAAALPRQDCEISMRWAEVSGLRFARHSLWHPEEKERPVFPCVIRNFFVDTGRPAITVEFSGQYQVSLGEVSRGLRFLRNAFRVLDMLPGGIERGDQPLVWMNDSEETAVETPCAGLFVKTDLTLNSKIERDALLGTVTRDDTLETIELRAPRSGYLFAHGRQALTTDTFNPLKAYHPYVTKGDTVAIIYSGNTQSSF